MRKFLQLSISLFLLSSLAPFTYQSVSALQSPGKVAFAEAVAPTPAGEPSSIAAPVLKWQNGGCTSWCETGWYSSPAVADLDGNGTMEVIGSGYAIHVLDGASGALEWRMKSGHDRSEGSSASNVGRTWPGIVVADVDGDGLLEIVTAHSGGYVSVYDHQGYFQSGWPQRPASNELRGLSVYDLDNNGSMEIIVTAASYSGTNTWVLSPQGQLRSGWPQLNGTGSAYGVFNDNAAIGDLDNDGLGELVIPSDVHSVAAYEANGTQIPASTIYGSKTWSQVGVWENLEVELRGWGYCDGTRKESFRPNFAHTPAAIADLNRDGVNEALVIGNMYNCISGYPSQYIGAFLFNADRSRFNTGGYDWSLNPIDTGAPIMEDYNVIESNMPNPVIADLDGDRAQEILYSSYDGRVHAFWLDKTEHGNWPYNVASDGLAFASEPVVADLDADGHAEVIFTTWVQKGTNQTGKLIILDYLGNLLQSVSLPLAVNGTWNGGLPAPTLANIDSDPDLEVVVNTAQSGIVAYDLPGTAGARLLWTTGRGSYLRNAFSQPDDRLHASLTPSTPLASPGDTLSYRIEIHNPGPPLTNVSLTTSLSAEISYAGSLTASSGSASYNAGQVTWSGPLAFDQNLMITFDATIDPSLTGSHTLASQLDVQDSLSAVYTHQASVSINTQSIFLPVLSNHAVP